MARVFIGEYGGTSICIGANVYVRGFMEEELNRLKFTFSIAEKQYAVQVHEGFSTYAQLKVRLESILGDLYFGGKLRPLGIY